MPSWAEENNEQSARGFRKPRNLDASSVRRAKSGSKSVKRRQEPQTIFLNEDIAGDVKDAVSELAERWNCYKNDVWQYLIVTGLRTVEDEEDEPDMKAKKRNIVLPDL